LVSFPLVAGRAASNRVAHMQIYRWWQSTMADRRVSFTKCTCTWYYCTRGVLLQEDGADWVANRIASSVFYWLVAASLAELASAMPSSGGGAYWLFVSFMLFCFRFASRENFLVPPVPHPSRSAGRDEPRNLPTTYPICTTHINESGIVADVWRSLPLGICYRRSLWTHLWFLRWLVELPGLGPWGRLYCADHWRAGRVDVCPVPPRLRDSALAGLRGVSDLYLGLLLYCSICKQGTSCNRSPRRVSCPRGPGHYHYRLRCPAPHEG
jgi:hypothetical protein